MVSDGSLAEHATRGKKTVAPFVKLDERQSAQSKCIWSLYDTDELGGGNSMFMNTYVHVTRLKQGSHVSF